MKERFSLLCYTGSAISLPFWGTTVFDLAGLTFKDRLPALRQHDSLKPVGVIDAVHKTSKELRASGYFLDTADGRECLALAKAGYPWQVSVGIFPDCVEAVEKHEQAEVNGSLVEGPLLIVRSAMLAEASFVSLGADDRTSVGLAAAASLPAVTGEWRNDPALRAQFGDDFNRFMAFRKGVESGQVNICIGRVIKG